MPPLRRVTTAMHHAQSSKAQRQLLGPTVDTRYKALEHLELASANDPQRMLATTMSQSRFHATDQQQLLACWSSRYVTNFTPASHVVNLKRLIW